MSKSLEGSLLSLALSEIMSAPGSPYLSIRCEIMLGGSVYTPISITQLTNSMDSVNNYSDEIYLYVAVAKGDIARYITPFQDDILVNLTVRGLTASGAAPDNGEENNEVEYLSRKYVAYIDDELPNAMSTSNDPNATSLGLSNLSDMEVIIFRLEERAVNEMKYIRAGSSSMLLKAPVETCMALLHRYSGMVKLDDDEKLTGPTVDPGSNPNIRLSSSIPDSTPLLDIPDIIQNSGGGIYKDALGFYIRNNHMYMWGLYNLDRKELGSEFRRLQIYISPETKSQVIEKTWKVADDNENVIQVWSAGEIKVFDESMELRQEYGDLIEVQQPARAMEGFVDVKNNGLSVGEGVMSKSFGINNNSRGKVIIKKAPPGVNEYVLNSMVAKAQGIKVVLQWNHSQPMAITPGMLVTLVYDLEGIIHNSEGTLLSAHTVIVGEGKGVNITRYSSTTLLTVFISRFDSFYKQWEEGGFEGSNVHPVVES